MPGLPAAPFALGRAIFGRQQSSWCSGSNGLANVPPSTVLLSSPLLTASFARWPVLVLDVPLRSQLQQSHWPFVLIALSNKSVQRDGWYVRSGGPALLAPSPAGICIPDGVVIDLVRSLRRLRSVPSIRRYHGRPPPAGTLLGTFSARCGSFGRDRCRFA